MLPDIHHKVRKGINSPELIIKKDEILNNLDFSSEIPIYKYFPLKHLISMLQNKKLLIGKVNSWEDVYENFLFKQPLEDINGNKIDWLTYTDCIYGQCWSLLRSSDAMWRIYSSVPQNINDIDNVAVRVQTTARKLWDVITVDDFSVFNSHLGIVRYKTDEEISTWLDSNDVLTANTGLTEVMFESLCIKREPFSHEEEIRILVMEENETDNKYLDENGRYDRKFPKFLSYDIDPAVLFDEFVIEPRIKDSAIVAEIERQLLVLAPTINVRQSELYALHHKKLIILQ